MTLKTQPSAVRCGVDINVRNDGQSYDGIHTMMRCDNVAIRVERWDGEWMPVCAECHEPSEPSISVKAYQAKCAEVGA